MTASTPIPDWRTLPAGHALDAVRRALVVLDELEAIVESVDLDRFDYAPIANEVREAIKTARGEVYGERRDPDDWIDVPPEEVTVIGVLRGRLTRALAVLEKGLMKGTKP